MRMIGAPFDKKSELRGVVRGRSFVDVGGLWGTVNEMVSVAAAAGATRTMMLDVTAPGAELWTRFHARMAELGVTQYETAVHDATSPTLAAAVGRFDVVHCSGVVYHLPDPIGFIANLHKITDRALLLSSMTVPETIGAGPERIDLSGGRFLATCGLDDAQRATLTAHFSALSIPASTILVAPEALRDGDGRPSYTPWWWLFTAESLRRLALAAGFEVDAIGESWAGRAHTLLCRPRGAPPVGWPSLSGAASTTALSAVPSAPRAPASSAPRPVASKEARDAARKAFPPPAGDVAPLGIGADDVAAWSAGVAQEAAFWAEQIRAAGGRWPEEWRSRLDPEAPADAGVEAALARIGRAAARVLDLGAGPLSCLGPRARGGRLAIVATDPLAPLYDALLARHGVTPPVRTAFGMAETAGLALGPAQFDLVHARNCLDHSINPFRAILEALELVAPGGALYLRHFRNEALVEQGTGFHRWNFTTGDGRFVIWNDAASVDVGAWLGATVDVAPIPGGLGAEALILPRGPKGGRSARLAAHDVAWTDAAAAVERIVRDRAAAVAAGRA